MYEDCTNAKVYTPLDFPETGDTGVAQEPTDTSDTAAGDTGASDTSDTGSGA